MIRSYSFSKFSASSVQPSTAKFRAYHNLSLNYVVYKLSWPTGDKSPKVFHVECARTDKLPYVTLRVNENEKAEYERKERRLCFHWCRYSCGHERGWRTTCACWQHTLVEGSTLHRLHSKKVNIAIRLCVVNEQIIRRKPGAQPVWNLLDLCRVRDSRL